MVAKLCSKFVMVLAGWALLGCSAFDSPSKISGHNLPPCFDDGNWRMTANALVYVWSPRMVLSVTQAVLAAHAAADMGLQFVPLVDGRLPPNEWHSALQRLEQLEAAAQAHSPTDARVFVSGSFEALRSTRRLCAAALIDRDAYRHFPTGFLKVGSVVHPFPLVGAMPQVFWAEGLRLRQQELSP